MGNEADVFRLTQQEDKASRDLDTATSYLGMMQLRAPTDGVVNVLSNFRSAGTFGQSTPPFREGDNVWNGAEIVEIPELTELYIDLKLEEVDRGKLQLGQPVRVRVDPRSVKCGCHGRAPWIPTYTSYSALEPIRGPLVRMSWRFGAQESSTQFWSEGLTGDA